MVRTENGLKVAVVGVGGWGKNHARVLDGLGCLAAICDLDLARAKEIADKYGAPSYSSLDEMPPRKQDAAPHQGCGHNI
jgi:UDP-N-acetylglucosamine 3-dehydrogenase